MKSTAFQDRIRDLLDQHVPLTAYERALLNELYGPRPTGDSIPPPARSLASHPAGCGCVECWNAGVRYGDYLKSKRLENL